MKLLKTINSKKSLITFDYTFRKQKIDNNGKQTKLIFKDAYAMFFKNFANTLKQKKYSRIFSNKSLWHKSIDESYNDFWVAFKTLDLKYKEDDKTLYNELITKARGNIGEILIESLAAIGSLSNITINQNTYEPVDPDAERGNDILVTSIDATAEELFSSNRIGIQIKNWKNTINERNVFEKALATAYKWKQFQHDITKPNQYIIGFSDSDIANDYEVFGIKFLGVTNYLNKLDILLNPDFYYTISQQIDNFS